MNDIDAERNALLKRFKDFLLKSPRDLMYPGVLLPVLVRLIAAVATLDSRDVGEEQAIENELLQVLINRKALERLQ